MLYKKTQKVTSPSWRGKYDCTEFDEKFLYKIKTFGKQSILKKNVARHYVDII